MNKTIFKYNLETTDLQIVLLPKGAEILTVQTQQENVKIWALVDPKESLEERTIEIFGTGNPIYYDIGVERRYISTYQLSDGNYIFHVFERIN